VAAREQDSPLRVGIVGYGKMGRIRADVIQKIPALELVCVCDSDPKAAALAPVPCYDDYAQVLETELDAVFVATYNTIAPEIVVKALQGGKHVFCEKPPGTCVEDVQRIMDAERDSGLCVKFGFNHRYHQSVMEAKSLIESGRFGDLMWMRGVYGKCGGIQFENSWRNDSNLSGGGILLDQGIHMLDLLLHFAGDFDDVQSSVSRMFWDVDVEDNAFAILRQSSTGTVALLHSTATHWKHRFSLEMCLQGGTINLDGLLTSTRSYGEESLTMAKRQFEDEARAFGRPREETIYFDRDESWHLEVEDFVEAILGGAPVRYGHTQDALRVMQLIEEIYRRGNAR